MYKAGGLKQAYFRFEFFTISKQRLFLKSFYTTKKVVSFLIITGLSFWLKNCTLKPNNASSEHQLLVNMLRVTGQGNNILSIWWVQKKNQTYKLCCFNHSGGEGLNISHSLFIFTVHPKLCTIDFSSEHHLYWKLLQSLMKYS